MAATETPRPAAAERRRLSTTDLALVAAFAALIAACTLVGGIPVGGAGVELTLQTFAITLAGCVLGPVRGFLAVVAYLAIGAAGLPVFAGHAGGPGVFTGITAGYLWSFPLVALLAGLLVQQVARSRRTAALAVLLCAAPGLVLNHLAGIAGMAVVADVSLRTAATWDSPYWLGDLLKIAVAAIVAAEVHRAFPHLLARGR